MLSFGHFRILLNSLIIFFLLLLSSSHAFAIAEIDDFTIDSQAILSKMSLDQKIGQLFIWSFDGKAPSPKLVSIIQDYHINSFILFKRNLGSIQQIKTLTSFIHNESIRLNHLSPLISMDHEGGVVSRLPLAFPVPSPLSIGQTVHPKYSKMISEESSKIFRFLGFNMNLAPVLDISDPYKKTFIASRSFGGDKNLVSRMGIEFTEGFIENGILPTAKHFPGIGSFNDDPHKVKTFSAETINDLLSYNVFPFQEYIKLTGPKAIMMSHHVFTKIDSAPASLSKTMIQDILRDKLNFSGIILTDDLMMGATASEMPIEKSVVQSLQAGVDLVMVAWSEKSQKRAFEAVRKAIANGDISEQNLNAKVMRLIKTKLALAKNSIHSKPIFRNDGKFIISDIISKVSDSVLNLNSGNQAKHAFNITKSDSVYPNNLCLISKKIDFINDFQRIYPKKISIFSSEKSLSKFTRTDCDFTLFHISSESSIKLIQRAMEFTNKERRGIVINTIAPFYASEFTKSYKVLDLFFQHQGTAQRISNIIPMLNPQIRSLSSLSDSPNTLPLESGQSNK